MSASKISRLSLIVAYLVATPVWAAPKIDAIAKKEAAPKKENLRTARVYELNDPDKRMVFAYQTWTEERGEERLKKAVFVNPNGTMSLEEDYWTKNGMFTRYELRDFDRKRTTYVRAENGKLIYELKDKTADGEKIKSDNEPIEPLHAVGPGLLDRLMNVWEKGVAGEAVELRLSVPDRFESFWFRFKKVAETEDEITFDLRPSSFVIAMFVKAIEFTFVKKTRLLKTYRGPTFVMRRVGNEWQQLLAVMEYDMGPTTAGLSPAATPKMDRVTAACLPDQAQCSVRQP